MKLPQFVRVIGGKVYYAQPGQTSLSNPEAFFVMDTRGRPADSVFLNQRDKTWYEISESEFILAGLLEIRQHEQDKGTHYFPWQTKVEKLCLKHPTLALLAPYVEAHIDMVCPHGIGKLEMVRRDCMFGANSTMEPGVGIWEELVGGTRTLRTYKLDEVFPILGTFAQLALTNPWTQEVPAKVIVAKRGRQTLPNEWVEHRPDQGLTGEAGYSPANQEVIQWFNPDGKVEHNKASLEPWQIELNRHYLNLKWEDACSRWAQSWVTDYLRSMGFAAGGLREHQYVPKP